MKRRLSRWGDRFFCVGVKCFVLRDLLVLKQMISFVEINPK